MTLFCELIYRYKREEVKIQAWENHQKRKAEMEMRKVEVTRLPLELFFYLYGMHIVENAGDK